MVEYIRKNSRITTAASASLLLIGLVTIWMQLRGHSRSAAQAFYTTDDGVTLFTDSADLLPPFDHDGKEAVMAAVYTCDNGQHRWVQYLFKYSPEAMAEAAQMKAAGAKFVFLSADRAQVKRPGDKQWIRETEGGSMMTPQCPDGQPGSPILVVP